MAEIIHSNQIHLFHPFIRCLTVSTVITVYGCGQMISRIPAYGWDNTALPFLHGIMRTDTSVFSNIKARVKSFWYHCSLHDYEIQCPCNNMQLRGWWVQINQNHILTVSRTKNVIHMMYAECMNLKRLLKEGLL